MNEASTMSSILTFSAIALAYALATSLNSQYKRRRFRMWCRCHILRNHAPGPLEDRIGGKRVQLCDYCDTIVHEYQITKDAVQREQREKIRRIY